MTHVSNIYSVVINAVPETVFNYGSDLTRHPEWSGGKLNPLMMFAFKLFIRPLIGQPMMDKSFAALKTKLEKTN